MQHPLSKHFKNICHLFEICVVSLAEDRGAKQGRHLETSEQNAQFSLDQHCCALSQWWLGKSQIRRKKEDEQFVFQ
jgi:hypothetical protein